MRKTLSLIYALVMTITLGACSGKHHNGNEDVSLGTHSSGRQAVKTDEQNNPTSEKEILFIQNVLSVFSLKLAIPLFKERLEEFRWKKLINKC